MTTDIREAPDWRDDAVKDALDRFLPNFTEGLRQDDVEKAGSTYRDLFTLSASSMNREEFGNSVEERIRKAGSLAPDGRRRMLEEDGLALEVERLDRQIREPALRYLRGEIGATGDVKKEVRRASARLGQVNAVLVGRFPHLTHLLERISEAYLDAMFILADGKSPLSTRLKKAKGELEARKESG
ncbi:MAG: hypothetical protein ABSD81_00245 [Methanomicrobiales archaeon]